MTNSKTFKTRIRNKSRSETQEYSFFDFALSTIANQREVGKLRTSETYKYTFESFRKYRQNQDLTLAELNSDIISGYEVWLKNNNICLNSSSFYMRNLRAIYNRAVSEGLCKQCFPFRNVYTGVAKTAKRALSLTDIKKIKNFRLVQGSFMCFVRDIFLFSFYTRGIAFVDLAYLKKTDVKQGFLVYKRKKTGQKLCIKWEMCMEEIVKRYADEDSGFMFPILNETNKDLRGQYIAASHKINRYLHRLGDCLKLEAPLTWYVARHSWASVARNQNIPISIISEGLGHDSEKTTQIYLSSLDISLVDKANDVILKRL